MASKVLSFLQMFRKGMIKPGCLIKCVKNVEDFDGIEAYRIFIKGRPYRVVIVGTAAMVLKSEGGDLTLILAPTPGKKSRTSWTAFGTFKS